MRKLFDTSLKRILDLILSSFGLIVSSPFLIIAMFLIWKQDRANPLYIAERIGRNFEPFKMVKLRSMIKEADKSGVDSTGMNDSRITNIGRIVRKYKLDELTQLWNVIRGDMSLVGPRPNVRRETDLYTDEEKRLLTIRPGITDFASIVFSDEGKILAEFDDPDLAYNQLIRPGKNYLGLYYVDTRSTRTDFFILFATLLVIRNRERALTLVSSYLDKGNAPAELVKIASRKQKLVASPPPGSIEIVISRETKS